MNILAIDIGGTMIKYGLVSSDGEILSTDKIETEAEKGLENILNKIDNKSQQISLYFKQK